MNFHGLALYPYDSTYGGETQPCSRVTPLGWRKPFDTRKHPSEGRKCCREPELPSPPFPFPGCGPQPPFPQLLVGGEPPTSPVRSRAALQPGRDPSPCPCSLLMPLRSLGTFHGAERAPHGTATALLPYPMQPG